MRFRVLLAVFLAMAGPVSFASEDVGTIIQRSLAANARDWQAAPQWEHYERDLQPHGGTKTYKITMLDGSPYQILVKINGQPLPTRQQQQQQRKLQSAINGRTHESAQQRQQRIASYEKERKRDNEMMDQLTRAFDFTLKAEDKVDGHDVYVLAAKPRPGYRPPTVNLQVLKGMEGELWIDKETYQWVKVEAHVIHPVAIEGFMARVEPGTEFELEKRPVGDNLWMPSHFSMRAHAKVLFVLSHNEQQEEWYFDWHKTAGKEPATH